MAIICGLPVSCGMTLEETVTMEDPKREGNDAPSGSLRPDLMEQPGLIEARFLFESAPFRSCHASTIAETNDHFVCAYFAGTDEGHPDVEIWLSRKAKEAREWSPPVKVADGVQEDGSRHPSWNPVLHQPRKGPLLLFYKVGPSPSSWWGMLQTSADQGATWSEARRLPEGILGPVRAKPIELPDGTLLCGSSTEHAGWRVHMERTPDLGATWTRTEPLNDGKEFRAIQPTILRHGEDRLQILCRSDGRLREAWSEDGGTTWTPLTPSVLPNPSAGIDAVTLPEGRHLLVYNHSTRESGGRSKLNVAVSDDGKEWKAALLLEDGVTIGGRRAYGAYPAAILASDGRVHITYTWKRERINWVVIDPAKLVSREMPGGEWPE